MSSLYELTNQFLEFTKWAEEQEMGDQAIADTLEALQMPLEEKVENIVKYMKSLEALADARKAEAKRLSDLASADLKKAEWFKNYMADNLKKAVIDNLQAGVFKLGWRKGSEVVEIDDEKMPMHILSADKTETIRLRIQEIIEKPLPKPELKKLIKDGLNIPGVSLVRKEDTLVVK